MTPALFIGVASVVITLLTLLVGFVWRISATVARIEVKHEKQAEIQTLKDTRQDERLDALEARQPARIAVAGWGPSQR